MGLSPYLAVFLAVFVGALFVHSRSSTFSSVAIQSIEYFARPHAWRHFEPIVGASAWKGSELSEDDYMINLTETESQQLNSAVQSIPCNKSLGLLTRDDLVLPLKLEEVINGAKWKRQLSHGLGFVAIRGIPTKLWTLEQTRAFFWVFGLKVGKPGLQDSDSSSFLTDVRDTKSNDPQRDRQYKTNAAQKYHVDAADVVGLLCINSAGQGGGVSRLISSVTIFNELLKTPNGREHVNRLYDSVFLDVRGSGGMKYVSVNPFRFANGKLRTVYHTDYFRTAYENYAGLGELPPDLKAALDAYDAVANRQDLSFDMILEPGTIQLVNNNFLLHSRTAYKDDPDSPRHLLRLWLTLDNEYSVFERVLKEIERVKVIASLIAAKFK